MEHRIIPNKLYKYQPVNNYTLANLKNNQIWFSNVDDFNDPFELRFNIDKRSGNDILNDSLKRHGITAPELSKEKSDNIEKAAEKTVEEFANNFKKYNGVSCFSELYDNILMWSHYADKHSGFCLEFDTRYELFNKIRKVNYSDDYPKISLDISKVGDKFLDSICTKNKQWGYEKEWRLLHKECNKLYVYDNKCLTGIYFGAKMPFVYKEIISLIMRGQSRTVKFYEGFLSEKKYELNFKQTEYTPYLERTDIKIV
ncbi:DUF2971 domain-containing protein [Clostridium sp. CT7]|uniref:DUF2971 domain-containing protein n=1 Tax=Clostridium sp. CT7 TaxID=2052574 RepID=UPI000A57C131|nr:DUF2971 domain-containing protein [Clostridium sp. CT7]